MRCRCGGDKMVFVSSFPIRSADPEFAVPPGRIGYDLDADALLLHTIQTSAAVDELRRNGVLRPEPEYTASEWPEAYAWMMRMMRERLPTSGSTAVWLWARIRGDDLIGNCRRARASCQEDQVLLTCRIPRERALLSRFDEWHCALNSFLAVPPRPVESENDYDARYTSTWTTSWRISTTLVCAGLRSSSGREKSGLRSNGHGSPFSIATMSARVRTGKRRCTNFAL